MAKVTEKIHINDVYNGKTSLSANSRFLHFFHIWEVEQV